MQMKNGEKTHLSKEKAIALIKKIELTTYMENVRTFCEHISNESGSHDCEHEREHVLHVTCSFQYHDSKGDGHPSNTACYSCNKKWIEEQQQEQIRRGRNYKSNKQGQKQ